MFKKAILVAVCALFLSSGAMAREGVNERQGNQVDRIQAGVHNGTMTRREAYDATRDLHRTQRWEMRQRRDGNGYGPRERARSQHMLNRSSRQIYRYKHN